MTFNIATVGLKGAVFLERLVERGILPSQIFSYKQSADDPYFIQLKEKAATHDVEFVDTKSPDLSIHMTFFIGWQYLVSGNLSNMVVFHDSLLPKYRGFAPTVAALINGDAEIGVSAIRPSKAIDAGPVISQRSWSVQHPMKIADALKKQANIMADMAIDLTAKMASGDKLAGKPQDEFGATYSLWRDAEDYYLDFNKPSDQLMRQIKAVGPPYDGAVFFVQRDPVRVFDARIRPDLKFTGRQPGKIWQITNDGVEVVCGKGMLVLKDMVDKEGRPWRPKTLRLRLKSEAN